MKRKNKIILLSTIIFLILITLILITYGYYLTNINGNTNDKSITVSLANLELTYNDGNGLISVNNIIPGENITTKTFSVENTGNKKVVNYVVYLENVINTFEDKNDLKLTLNCTSSINSNCMENNTIYPDKDTLLVLNDIEVGEIQTYELKVDFIETHDDQSDNMNKIIEGNIVIKDLKETENSLETVTGTDNVMLDNPILTKNYRIYGNSVQDGTPTPDTPIEIQSVGDKTKNILKLDEIYGCRYAGEYYPSGVDLNNKLTSPFIEPSNYRCAMWLVKVKPNTTYTFSTDMVGDKEIRVRGAKFTSLEDVKTYQVITKENKIDSSTFTTNDDTEYILIGKDNNDPYPTALSWTWAQLEEAAEATENEPYGYKIPVKTRGKNLFDINELEVGTIDGYGNNANNNTRCRTGYILYKAGTYTFSKNKTEKAYTKAYKFDINKNNINFIWNDMGQKHTFTIEEDCYIKIAFDDTIDVIKDANVQVELGTEATEYEPYQEPITTTIYLNEPLRKVGDYADYIDFKKQKVIRKVKVVDDTGILTLEKSYQGLSIPTEESIELPTISTNKGTNIIEVDTTISPSKIDIEYLK